MITVDLNKYNKYGIKDDLFNQNIKYYSLIQMNSKRKLESSLELEIHEIGIEEDLFDADCNKKEIMGSNEVFIEENENINELTKLIMTQNIFEGFWDENDETKKLIQILPKNKIMEIENKIKKFNKNEENKIKYTIIVLVYLEYKHKDKLDEFKLIINKANKFLMSHGIKYEEIINKHS